LDGRRSEKKWSAALLSTKGSETGKMEYDWRSGQGAARRQGVAHMELLLRYGMRRNSPKEVRKVKR